MLCQLAWAYPTGGPLQLSEIGEREGVSERYLGQIMLTLRSSGLVSAVRGPQGGYFLSREPGSISLLEIFSALESETLAFDEGAGDERSAAATMALLWSRLRSDVEHALSGITLNEASKLAAFGAGYQDYSI